MANFGPHFFLAQVARFPATIPEVESVTMLRRNAHGRRWSSKIRHRGHHRVVIPAAVSPWPISNEHLFVGNKCSPLVVEAPPIPGRQFRRQKRFRFSPSTAVRQKFAIHRAQPACVEMQIVLPGRARHLLRRA